MPSTLFPLPIAISQLKRNFSGLGDVLEAVADYSGQTVEEIAAEEIRKAQFDLETALRMPFFLTRYATEEIAAYPAGSQGGTALVLGEDYDRIIQPQDYIIDDWQQGTGRMTLPWFPIEEITTYRFSFASQGHIVDIPLGWLNNDAMKGVINILPQGIGISSTQYFRLLLLFPFYRGSPSGVMIPQMIHMRYTAGLVDAKLGESDEYGEDAAIAPQKETKWDQGLVSAFQKAIAWKAAGPILRVLLNEIDLGGASISFAGLSESVNPNVLETRADKMDTLADKWVSDMQAKIVGPVFVMV